MSATATIRPNQETLSMNLPTDYIGPVTLPGNGRTVYWTGRVAIGLRHQAPPPPAGVTQSALWIQDLLLAA